MLRSPLLFPFYVIVIIFIVDKAALIPAIQKYGRSGPSPIENMMANVEYAANYWQSENKEVVITLGSSRSVIFQNLAEETINNDRHLNNDQKDAVLKRTYEPRFSVRAMGLFSAYLMLRKAHSSELPFEHIIIEVSPEMFNAGSPTTMRNQMAENIYPYHILPAAVAMSRGEIRRNFLIRLLFPSYNFRFKPDRALRNFLAGNEVEMEAPMAQYLFSQMALAEPISDSYQDFRAGSIPSDIKDERFIEHTDYLVNEFVMRNYHLEPSKFSLLQEIVEYSDRHDLPVIVWMPAVHESLEAEWYRTDFFDHYDWMISLFLKHDVPFVDYRNVEDRCQYYTDSSHLSGRCAPHIIYTLLQAAEEQNEN